MRTKQQKIYVYFDSNVNSALATNLSNLPDNEADFRRWSIAAIKLAEKLHYLVFTSSVTVEEGHQGKLISESVRRVANAKQYKIARLTRRRDEIAAAIMDHLGWKSDRLKNDARHIAVAIDARADYMLTGDSDILKRQDDIAVFCVKNNKKILTACDPKDFCADRAVHKNPATIRPKTMWERENDSIRGRMSKEGYGWF